MNATLTHSRAVAICLPSRLDITISPFFLMDLKRKLRPGVVLTIDMTKTTSIESDSISIFRYGIFQAQKKGAKIVIKGMNQQIKLILEEAGLLLHLQQS